MKTHSINDIVYRVLTGEATDEDDEQLRLWLEESDEHRRQYEQLAGSTELLERYRFAEGIDVEKAWQLFRRRHLRKTYPLLKRLGRVAVVIVLLTGIAWWWNSQHSRLEKPQLPADVVTAIAHAEASGKNHALLTVAGQRIEVDNDKELAAVHGDKQPAAAATSSNRVLTTYHDSEFWLTLDDGTRVHLNYGTSLTYPVRFAPDERVVELDGEAFFFVAKDKKRPFYVKTRNGTVKEYGTSFNVNTCETPGQTKVVLVDGSISIITDRGREFIVNPGEMATMSRGESQVFIDKVDVRPYKAWNEGRFVFEDCTLESLMEVLSLWYNRKVEFESDELREIHFTGTFDRYDDVNQILRAIEQTTDVDIESCGDTILLKTK